MYIDCHAHIFFTAIPIEAIDNDITGEIPTPRLDFITKMVFNAKKNGVDYIVGVISNPKDFTSYQSQLEFEDTIHVIGISRDNASKDHSHMISLLQKEIEIQKPQGIGEIGLDYSHGFNNFNKQERISLKKNQQELFRKQIQIAKDLDVPIVVHAGYGTDKDIVEIINQEQAQDVGGQIHGYMSEKKSICDLLEMGFYFSFGYLHLREEELKRVIKITPVEQILTETDSPYHLMEAPKKFILPEDVVFIANKIALLKEVEPEVFAHQVMKNARELFRF